MEHFLAYRSSPGSNKTVDGHSFIDETLLGHSFDLENYWPNLIIVSPQ